MHAERRDESASQPDPTRSFQFPREFRLTQKIQYDAVLAARGFQIRSGCLRAFVISNDRRGARLGLIVGKRQLKRAVDRNDVKRALRESFRVARGSLPSFDVVVQLTSAPRDEPIRSLADALWTQLARRDRGTRHGDA
jgi:ribonuclease P protein component